MKKRIDEIIWDWVHESPEDDFQIRNRALIVAASPLFIGVMVGLIAVNILFALGI